MARHSQRIGPPAAQEIPAVFTTINNCVVTRHWDSGALFVAYSVDFDHTVAGTIFVLSQVVLDTVAQLPLRITRQTSGIIRTQQSSSGLILVTEGVHTIALQLAATAGVGDLVQIDSAHLTILQLPVWDDFSDIETT
jgi:hypothetical protein